ncbi:hypothetical protein RSSM_06438 [Rhodopirellula sallentina SM41]|uniref:Uncharacterized protein n=1 Tax=Rhodopirellula sallentina SM41 TaxID=1263870 RepID=M5TSH7_9BACT|nr:hypothetical protein RSSM_06438 [Rhodopirellula sallentina SM41]
MLNFSRRCRFGGGLMRRLVAVVEVRTVGWAATMCDRELCDVPT